MAQVATNKQKWEIVARPYPPEGCPVHQGTQKCGETKGLDIISDFQKLYQEKMSQIDVSAGGDSLQEKVILQQEWINDLTEQNKMLAKVIEELEMEAIGRVKQLEDKLKNAAKSFGEDNDQALADQEQKIRELEERLKALPVQEPDTVKEKDTAKEEDSVKEKKEVQIPVVEPLPSREIEKVDTFDTVKEIKEEPSSAPAASGNLEDVKEENDRFQQFQPDMASEKEIDNVEMSLVPSKPIEPSTASSLPILPQSHCVCTMDDVVPQSTKRSSMKSTEFMIPDTFIKAPPVDDDSIVSKPPELLPVPSNKHRRPSEHSSGRITTKDSGGTDKKSVLLNIGSDTENVVVEPEKDLTQHPDELSEVPRLDAALVVGTKDSLELLKRLSSGDMNDISLSSSEELIVVENMLKKGPSAPNSGRISNKESTPIDKKSVHLVIEDEIDHAVIVEPQKDRHPPEDIQTPHIDSVPVIGTTDSLELVRKKSTSKKNLVCLCNKDYELLKEENEKLRNGDEVQRLTSEVEDKVRRILELNEENRMLNDMVNKLKNQQPYRSPGGSDPKSTDSENSKCECNECVCRRKRRKMKERTEKDYLEQVDTLQGRKCVCFHDESDPSSRSEKKPPGVIDVYKFKDQGKFNSDSSSTVCNEDTCGLRNSPTCDRGRARGGNDFSVPCNVEALPNYDYQQLMQECSDSNCPNKDPPYAPYGTQFNVCYVKTEGFTSSCTNQDCQTEGCENCFETFACGVEEIPSCTDQTCPNKDYYPPAPAQGYGVPGQVESPSAAPQDAALPEPQANDDFPISCMDATCDVPKCPMRSGGKEDESTIQESVQQGGDFPVTCDDTTCQSPECGLLEQYDLIASVIEGDNVVVPKPFQPETSVAPSQLSSRPVEDVQPAPISSVCVCVAPTECQDEAESVQMHPPPIISIYTGPPNVSSSVASGVPGQCPRGVCDTCVCIQFPAPSNRPASALPYVPSQHSGPQPGTCIRGICETCACKIFPDIGSYGPRPATAPVAMTASQQPSVQQPSIQQPSIQQPSIQQPSIQQPSIQQPVVVQPTELCRVCGCPLSATEIMPGQKFDEGTDVKPTTTDAATTSHLLPEALPSIQAGSAIHEAPKVPCVCSGEEILIKTEELGDESIHPDQVFQQPCICEKPGTQVTPSAGAPIPSAITPSAPVAEACPDEICGVSCTCEIVPSTGEFPDSDIDIGKVKQATVPRAMESEKPSMSVNQHDSKQTTEGSVVVKEEASHVEPEKPADIASEKPSESAKVPAAGVQIIRCMCKSKYCKIVPDPNNPDVKLCVDASEFNLRPNLDPKESNCVCSSCPNADADQEPEEIPDCPANCRDGSVNQENLPEGSMQSKQVPVYTMASVRTNTKWSRGDSTPTSLDSAKSLSKEQEYAGLSRKEKENDGRKANHYFPPKKSGNRYDLDDKILDDENENKAADLKLVIADLKSKLLDAEDKIEELKSNNPYVGKDNNMALISKYSEEIEDLKKSLKWTNKEKEEYALLKEKVKSLEQGKGDTESVTVNLQTADDNVVMQSQLKKLSKKNKCYEEVVKFFKQEMSVMSEELFTLQEVLVRFPQNVTNVSSLEENNKLINAILQLRRINDGLVNHLCAIEKQVVLENQINQINEARINELQHIIGEKNNDLNQHDEIIHDMRKKLSNANKQNADLKNTIKNLTDTVVEIQEGIKSVDTECRKAKGDKTTESKVCLVNGDVAEIKVCMEQKNEKILNLENRVKEQEVSLILANNELKVLNEKKLENNDLVNSLKEQLAISEKKNMKMIEEYQTVVKQLRDYSSFNHMKNFEVKHYKSLVEEMKMSLMQLNNGLEKCEATNIHFYEDSENCNQIRGIKRRKDNLSIVLEELKRSMADIRTRLSEADIKGGLIEEEIVKVKDSHMSLIEEDITEDQKDLEARIMSSVEEQTRLNLLINAQKDEIDRLRQELSVKETEEKNCSCKRSVSELKNEKMASNAQMEISQLKSDLNKSLQRQKMLNEENDKIHTQMINLRKKLTMMEHAYEVLKQENEENKMQLKKSLREKEYASYKHQEMTKNMEQLKNSHDNLEKQCRMLLLKQSAENQSWDKIPMKETSSGQRYATAPYPHQRAVSPIKSRRSDRYSPERRHRLSGPWRHDTSYEEDFPTTDSFNQKHKKSSYSSYSSPYSSRTPSPRSNSVLGMGEEEEETEVNLDDWFSPNYRETDTDLDEGDEDTFINKLELMTVQVQEANKRWQQKMGKDKVSRSRVKK